MPVRYRSKTVKKETLHTVSLLAPHVDTGRVGARRRLRRGLRARRAGRARRQATFRASTSSTSAATRTTRSACTTARRCRSPTAASTSWCSASCCTTSRTSGSWRCSRRRCASAAPRSSSSRTRRRRAFDRLMNRRHGESYRRKIKSTASFGFLTAGRVALAVPRHGPRAGDASAVAVLPLDPAAVRAHGVPAAEVPRHPDAHLVAPRRGAVCDYSFGSRAPLSRPHRRGVSDSTAARRRRWQQRRGVDAGLRAVDHRGAHRLAIEVDRRRPADDRVGVAFGAHRVQRRQQQRAAHAAPAPRRGATSSGPKKSRQVAS